MASSWGAELEGSLPLRSQILGVLGPARRLSAALVVSVQWPAEPAGLGPLPPAIGLWLLLEDVKRPLPPAQWMVWHQQGYSVSFRHPHFITLPLFWA